ncbi:hypothetical protein Dimus_007920, partial [Dionaea muscipula]
ARFELSSSILSVADSSDSHLLVSSSRSCDARRLLSSTATLLLVVALSACGSLPSSPSLDHAIVSHGPSLVEGSRLCSARSLPQPHAQVRPPPHPVHAKPIASRVPLAAEPPAVFVRRRQQPITIIASSVMLCCGWVSREKGRSE